jgi:hypothetical protein
MSHLYRDPKLTGGNLVNYKALVNALASKILIILHGTDEPSLTITCGTSTKALLSHGEIVYIIKEKHKSKSRTLNSSVTKKGTSPTHRTLFHLYFYYDSLTDYKDIDEEHHEKEDDFDEDDDEEDDDEKDDDEEDDQDSASEQDVDEPVIKIVIAEDDTVTKRNQSFQQLTGAKRVLKQVVFDNTSSKRSASSSSSSSRTTRSSSSLY